MARKKQRKEPKYIGSKGASYSKEKIKIFALELHKLERSGPLTPERVVVAASLPNHPLHGCFEWDDRKAAEGYRLWQARRLIGSILIEVIEEESEPFEIRAFVSVEMNGEQQYVSLNKVMSKADLREQAINDTVQRLRYWQKVYKAYSGLAAVFGDAARKVSKLKKKKKGQKRARA